MMNCKEAAQLFYEYMDKELSTEDIAKLEEHLKLCKPCLGHFEFDQALKSLVQKKSDQLSIPESIKEQILKNLPPDN